MYRVVPLLRFSAEIALSLNGFFKNIPLQLIIILCLLSLSMLGALAAPVPSNKPANYPSWWFSREVISRLSSTDNSPVWPGSYPVSDDYAVVNEGQLKNFAIQAYNELYANTPISVWSTPNGLALTAEVQGWNPATSGEDDYKAINLGQLKTVAKPFYDVLIQIGHTSSYPWTGASADDYIVANIGQVKNTFSFQFPLSVPNLTVITGTYSSPQSVTLAPPAGQSFYYTLDGSDPNSSASRILVTSAVTLNFTNTTTLKVIAVESGFFNSLVSTLTITVDANEAAFDAYNRRPRYLLRPVP